MIRELFVELGEAAIAAIKAQADEHTAKAIAAEPPMPEFSLMGTLNGLVGILHETLGERTLRVERDFRAQVLIFSHRCKLCNKRHCARVDEPMFAGAVDSKAFVDLLYSEVKALLQRPCEIELGKRTLPPR